MAAHERVAFTVFLLIVLLGLATAQEKDDGSNLQPCQGQCITDLVQQANTYNCSAGDVLCACHSNSYIPAIYDCANKACPAGTDQQPLTAYQSHICSAASSASVASAGTSSAPFSVTLIPSLTTSSTVTSSTPLSTASLTGGATVTIFTAAGPAQTSSTVTASSSNGGLSTGAKAGIGVGVSLGALAIVALAAFLCFRQRRRRPARVDSFRARPEYTRDEIHRESGFGGQAYPEMNETESSHPSETKENFVIPPLPPKSRARTFSGTSNDFTNNDGTPVSPLGRHPSERERAPYADQRYSWSTDPRSEIKTYDHANGHHSMNGIGHTSMNGHQSMNGRMSPVSPVEEHGNPFGSSNGYGDAGASEASRDSTIGGPEYRTLQAGRRPSLGSQYSREGQ